MTALEAHLLLLSTGLVLGFFGPFAAGKSCFRQSELSRVSERWWGGRGCGGEDIFSALFSHKNLVSE